MPTNPYRAVRDSAALITAVLHGHDVDALWLAMAAEQPPQDRTDWALAVTATHLGIVAALMDRTFGTRQAAIDVHQQIIADSGADSDAFHQFIEGNDDTTDPY